MSQLTAEEKEILEAFEKGRLARSKDAEAIQRRHRDYAGGMLKKDARINVRLT